MNKILYISFIILLILLLIFLFILSSKSKKYKIITYILCIPIVTLIMFSSHMISVLDNTNEYINYNTIKKQSDNEKLSLSLENNTLSYTSDTSKKVSYLYDNDEIKNPNLYPIYLKPLDDYYLVILSKDKNKTIKNDLFTQIDYETHGHHTTMIVISRQTGRLSTIRPYGIIGKTINLSLITQQEHTIAIPVYKPYSLNIAYYMSLFMLEDSDIFYVSEQENSFANNRDITKYVYLDNAYMTLYNNQDILLYTSTRSFTYAEYKGKKTIESISSQSRYIDLKDETYIKQGYFDIKDGNIYVVKNDLAIYKFDNGIFVFIQTINHIDEFNSFIKA